VVVVQKFPSSSSFASKLLTQMSIEKLIDVAITLYKDQYTNARLET
jgi:hypothetical protein